MPISKKGAPARATGKNATGGAKKPRWSTEQRAAQGKSPVRPRGTVAKPVRERQAESSARRDDVERGQSSRPNWEPREKSSSPAGNARFQHTERPARGDSARGYTPRRDAGAGYSRTERPRTEGYAPRADRPVRDYAPRQDRSYAPRTERPAREGYATRSDRPARDSYATRSGGYDRSERPAPHHAEDVVLARLEAQAVDATDMSSNGFLELGLGQNIVRALADLGAENPFPIQAATIPSVLDGRDVLGRGKTGSGKTIAFGAPLVERLLQQQKGSTDRRKPGRAPRALILAPTRELALQIDRTVQPIAQSVGLFTTQIYGGVPYARQTGAISRGVDIIIGTPGRIGDLVGQGRLDLSQVMITVLDEADHMCELGFLEPVRELLQRTKEGGQKLLYSATLDSGVASLVDEFLVTPDVYEIAGEDQASSDIRHIAFLLDQRDKQEVLIELAGGPGKKLVFARTRAFAEQLADLLDDAGIRAESIHGDLNQARRTRALEKFTSGRVSVLVATDVAARGIHVDDIELVIQADAPDEYKAYLHRAGRTGRAGKTGTVVTLVPRNRRRKTEDLLARAEISPEWISVRPGDPQIAAVSEKAVAGG
jgi:superfamily II DNA/RNA helicase